MAVGLARGGSGPAQGEGLHEPLLDRGHDALLDNHGKRACRDEAQAVKVTGQVRATASFVAGVIL